MSNTYNDDNLRKHNVSGDEIDELMGSRLSCGCRWIQASEEMSEQ